MVCWFGEEEAVISGWNGTAITVADEATFWASQDTAGQRDGRKQQGVRFI